MPPERDEDEDVLDLTEDQQLNPDDESGDDQQPGQDDEGGADGDDDEGAASNVNDENDDEETVVSFGDESVEADQPGDSSVIKQLRRELREAKQRIRESEQRSAPAKRERRPEPTMEDHAFDEGAFKADWKAWNEENAEIDREEKAANEAQQEIQRQWEQDVARFEKQKGELGLPDIEDAQETVAGSLNLAQQAVIVKAAENPALLMYALGKSPAKLAELAKITDVIKLAAAVAKMEGTVKVTKTKRNAPNIDRPQRGSAPLTTSDKKLERLEEEANRTGDRTKLQEYKRELKERESKRK